MTTRDTRRLRARFRRGQALIEATVAIVLFIFIGIMGYEAAVLQHNLTLIQEAVRESAWVAARGGNDAVVMEMVSDAGTRLITGAFMSHAAFSFAMEVWTDTYGAYSLPWSAMIAPTYDVTVDSTLSPGSRDRAAYLYRTQGMTIRIGVAYTMVVGAPFFGTFEPFKVRIPITASEPIVVRNDEDRDGMVDLYEQEPFARRGMLPQTPWGDYMNFGIPTANSWGCWPIADNSSPGDAFTYFPYSHTDSGSFNGGILTAVSDEDISNIDGDTLTNEGMIGNFEQYDYDYDNDGTQDKFDYQASNGQDSPQMLRHPRFGGRAL